MNMIIKYCDWGLAERTADTIYLNKNLNLPEWQFLKAYLLEHEMGHTEHEAVTAVDVLHDLKQPRPNVLKSMILFMLQYPKALTQLTGLSIRDGELCYDKINLIVNAVFVFLACVIAWIVFKVFTYKWGV